MKPMLKYQGKQIEVVWLDLDDTLIDFKTNSRTALYKLYNIERLDRYFSSAEAWYDCYEKHNKELWALYALGKVERDYLRMQRFLRPLAEARVPCDEAHGMAVKFDTFYLDLLAQEKQLMPGALHILEYLRRSGVKIGVLSNGFKEVQHRKIVSAGIDGYIDILVLSDDIGVNKPDVRLYHYAMERSECVDATRHLMVGDNAATDIAGALAAGWNAILYNPHSDAPLHGHEGYVEVAELEMIESLVETT